MLVPVRRDLVLYPGLKFDPLFQFFADKAKAVPFPLTGYSAQLVIGAGVLVLASPAALTLGGAAGTVQVSAGAAVTAELAPGVLPWFLQWTPSGGEPDCPVAGELLVKLPSQP